MGNCCTTTSDKETGENAHRVDGDLKQNGVPPSSSYLLLEEESVKEVLSETPTMPKRPAVFRNHKEPRKFTPPLANFRNVPDGKPRKDVTGFKKPAMIYSNPEEFSEDASEICSTHSESVSAATYYTEKTDNHNDDVAEIRQRSPAKIRNRTFPGEVTRERSTGRSPVKKSDASPNRLRSSGSWRENSSFIPNVPKRDWGESSGRRSGSPATRTDGGVAKMGLSRSGSTARKTGKSPGRVSSEVGEKIRKLGDEPKSVSREERWPPTSNESLENPLVSLECFIFL